MEVRPPADDYSAAVEALEIAELAGLELDDWQQFVVLVGLARQEGLWAAFEVALIVSRQNGKSEILIAVILWALYTEIDDPRLTVFAAHEYKTAREIFLRLRMVLDPPRDLDPLLKADAYLLGQVKTIRTANGEESVELSNGRRVRFLARTSGSGRGFTGDLVLLDEAYKLNQEQMSALLPTMGARPNPQIWYASMGPFEDSDVQNSLMDRARGERAESFCYLGWEAEGQVDDRDEWIRCNPAHPHRMTLKTLENEYRALGSEGFAREKLCMRVSKIERAIPAESWVAVQDPNAEPSDVVTLAVDMSEDRGHYAVVAVGGGAAELVEHKPVSGLLDRLDELSVKYGSICIDQTGPAASLIDELEQRGVPLQKFSGRDIADACGRLYDDIADRNLKVRSHPAFDHAVSGAAKKPLGDSWGWSRTKSTEDISPLVALTMANAAEPLTEVSVMLI